MPVHFFTRRTYDPGANRFVNQLAPQTSYVALDESTGVIPPSALLAPRTWADAVLQRANGGPILCFVHGYNTDQNEMLARLALIEAHLENLGRAGTVIAFDWPSKGTLAQYFTDRNTAKTVAPLLVTEGLGLFMNTVPRHRLQVLAHSMGAMLTLRGFSQVGDAGSQAWGVGEVALVAADNEASDLLRGTGLAKAMAARAIRMTNYHSNQDAILDYAQNLPGQGERLGYRGMPRLLEDNHVDVYCGRRYFDKIPKPPSGTLEAERHSHTWYFEDGPGFYKDLKATLEGVPASQMGTTRGKVPSTGDQALL